MNNYNHEVNKFNKIAHEWWNTDGEFKTLHHINPTRLQFIKNHVNLPGKKLIDIGCGGGILSESLANEGSVVTAIDLAPLSIEVAKLHLYESGLVIDYRCVSIEKIVETKSGSFEILTCMEMLEHVNNPELVIANCAKLLKPGGYAFFSTLNRGLKSYILGVLATEYILNIIPKKTHNYASFIKPSELQKMLSKHGLFITDIRGISYNPFTFRSSISSNVDVNYIVCCVKDP